MRTTLDIDTPVLDEIKRLRRRESTGSRSLGKVVSELLTEALARRRWGTSEKAGFEWISKPMAARVDLDDKAAVHGELEEEG